MKYGDYDNVKKDVSTLNDILSRQGSTLLMEVIAEQAGNTAIKHNLNHIERERLLINICADLQSELCERL